MGYLDRIASSPEMTRRTFVAATSATAALAAVALSGCNVVPDPHPDPEPVVHRSDERDLVTGEWKLGACWHNCGGRCSNRVLVRDGIIVRQATDNTGEDTYEDFQRRACVRGHAQRMQTIGADRLRYPMKRKHWMPGGIVDSGWLRGRDEWERISWEDAIKYIMEEADRIYKKWGSDALLCTGNGTSSNVAGQYFKKKYGYWGTVSWGSWYRTAALVGMVNGSPSADMNDRFDWKNCEHIVFLGANPIWSAGGHYAWMGYQSIVVRGEGKIKTYFVDPMHSETCSLFDGKWIQCRPSMDMPLYLAIAYEMWRMDTYGSPAKQYIDWDFLNNRTIGFDAEHMPETANGQEVDPSDNLLDYLKGTKDGIVKN
ncbi:MAG: molybdopterin-dependent oxidoreductase, partial [Eggerthellaceae bacterium]|nr:molybdopterin-dependent oxidoreductase [Eggerthellaceae bacterium]